LSDIHASNRSLASVQDHIGEIERLYFLGDLFDRGSQGVVTFLLFNEWFGQNSKNKWISGNHDRAISWLKDANKFNVNSNFYKNMTSDLQERCKELARGVIDDHVFTAAQKPTEDWEQVDQLKLYMTHGFPDRDQQQRLMKYDFRNPPSNGTPFAELAGLTNNAHVWLVGHSHCQTAWLFTAGENGGWSEWIPGFGTDLNGQRRLNNNNEEAILNFGDLPEGSFLVLNPGSVGDPRDAEQIDEAHIAKYLTLDIQGTKIHACFYSILVN
jgi:predicted phosphodiesterase